MIVVSPTTLHPDPRHALPRCPANSRTLQKGSFSFTDCGCEEGYIDVATQAGGHDSSITCISGVGCQLYDISLWTMVVALLDRVFRCDFEDVSCLQHRFLSTPLTTPLSNGDHNCVEAMGVLPFQGHRQAPQTCDPRRCSAVDIST